MKRRIAITVTTLCLLLGCALWSQRRVAQAGALTGAAPAMPPHTITFAKIIDSFVDPANPDYPFGPVNSFVEAYAPSLEGDDLAFIVSAGGQNQRVLTTVVGGVRRTVAEDATGRTTWPNLPGGCDPRFWEPVPPGGVDFAPTQISFENGQVAFLLDTPCHYGAVIGDASQPPASRLRLLAGHQNAGGPYADFYGDPLDPLEDLHVELDQGKVVFLAYLVPDASGAARRGIFRVAMDGTTETLYGIASAIPAEFGAGGGRMAYTGTSDIHVRDGSGADVIAIPGGIGYHFSMDGGDLAFAGTVGGSAGVLKQVGGTLSTVRGPDGYGAVSLDNGKVAFATKTAAQQYFDDVNKIYTDFNGNLERVVGVGDFITGGGTITKLFFGREGLSGNKLAFGAKFANGRAAIYVATLDSPLNTPPTISGATIARQQGAAGASATIATVSDAEDAAGSLVMTVISVPTGITVTGLTNTDGAITANVAAACDAAVGAGTVVLRVTDSGSLTATANLTVNVSANPAPSLGDYPNATVTAGGGATITPSSPPSDDGSISSVAATAPGFTGALAVNAATGVVTVSSAGPVGGFPVTVKATDNCGAQTTKTFTLTVAADTCGINIIPATLPQPYVAVSYARMLAATPAGNYTFSVSAGALPPGLQLATAFGVTSIAGSPATPGAYNFTIKARRNGTACEATRSYTLTIPATVVPILGCVERNRNGSWTARFGYDNSTGATVTIPVGNDNYFAPGNRNRGQTTVFQPGRRTNAFSVTFNANGASLGIWYLRGPDGVLRTVNALTTSIGCP